MTDKPSSADIATDPQYIVEGIILRRLHEKRIEGYTIEMAKEIVASLQPATPVEAARAPNPRVIDTDDGEIAVTLDGRELRGWSYSSDTQRQIKMLCAREYVEGWCDGRDS